MNADLMEKHFARMGARMKLVRHEPVLQPWGWNRRSFVDRFSVDIERDRRGEHFVFNVSTDVEDLLEVDLLQVQPKERHLLLMVKDPDVEGKLVKDRFSVVTMNGSGLSLPFRGLFRQSPVPWSH